MSVIPSLVNASEIIGGLAALGAIIRQPLLRIFKRLESVSKAADLAPLVESLKAEFRPNGGSSLRDAITALEKRVKKIEEATEWQNGVLAKLLRRAEGRKPAKPAKRKPASH